MQDKYKAPVIVWLAGGPGTSALFSQFMAHGPIRIENDSFERRELHWALNHHVIYIDNPVGAGFSFTNDSEGYCTNESMAPWISELLEYYRVLVYNGQLDIIIPYPGTVDFIRHLNFSGAEEYEKASRNVWRVNGDVAGYVKQAGKLTEILVRNAGHMVPLDQPEWARDMITRFTYNRSFIN
ncbi:vitellogenic carboxypeptidase-like [Leguminivora glycinivorella]|uniref:vitellogenic carboxypeptidase-like n=1 Tax=Leguminivora glycinivorella TaxID=1035111 RepID=UPI00200DBE65|nr:vitellogenic carboxypeptidase-like [Leguminivora glycinivorella]